MLLDSSGLYMQSLLVLEKIFYPEHTGKHQKALRSKMRGSHQLLGGEQINRQLERRWKMSYKHTAVDQAGSLSYQLGLGSERTEMRSREV